MVLLNLSMTIYVGKTMSMNIRLLNRISLFNEFMVSIITLHILFFTEWLPLEIQE